MEHPKTFLLKKIIGYDKNGLNSLGYLQGKHVDDLAQVIKEFAELTAVEVIERLNKGQSVEINGTVFCMKKVKRR